MFHIGKILPSVACFLVFIGALNWGLVGIFDFNVVTALFGEGTLTKVLYVAIGFSAVFWGYTACEKCGSH